MWEVWVTNYILFIPDTRRTYEKYARVLIDIQCGMYARGYVYVYV
jgi:hypothetical protein